VGVGSDVGVGVGFGVGVAIGVEEGVGVCVGFGVGVGAERLLFEFGNDSTTPIITVAVMAKIKIMPIIFILFVF
jgi:hypothetical protein